MITTLYPQVADRLAEQVPGLQWIDLDQGQLDFLEQEYAIPFPAAFIDMEEAQWSDIAGGVQRGDVIVRVIVAVEVLQDSYQTSTQREAAMQKLQLLEQVHKALHHWQGEGFSKLVRVSQRRERPQHPLWVYSLAYKVLVTDDSAADQPAQEVQAGLKATPRTYPVHNGENSEYIL